MHTSSPANDRTKSPSAASFGNLKPLSVCLINPKFEPSFFGFNHALPLMPGAKLCWMVTGALPALAALAPPHCTVTLLDENVEPIDFGSLSRFDVIGVTGMIVQGGRMREILLQLRASPALVAVGGPYVSVAENEFAGLCDVRFIGEAEQTWPAFLECLGAGEPIRERYEQTERTDMRDVPAPRYDLVNAGRYQMASLQFSRGCPFLCEFCDIITVFGRKPRTKGVDQMIVELDAVRRAGFRHCFLVDDNFIGNKRAARALLAAIVGWQRANGYPLRLYTEASIDLAEHADMIEMMVEANFLQVFVGIESPRRASLAETRKVQNIRGDGLEQKIGRIRDGGLVIQAGFIVGFDHDDEAIFAEQFDFIHRTGLAQALVAVLSPIPTTPLYDRLKAEGRLDFSDSEIVFRPKRMSREALKRGYGELMRRLYEPEAYFGRLFVGYRGSPAFRRRRARLGATLAVRPTLSARLTRAASIGLQALRLARALTRAGLLRRMGGAYLKIWLRENRPLGADAIPLGVFIGACVTHWHFFNIARLPRKGAFGTVLAQSVIANAA